MDTDKNGITTWEVMTMENGRAFRGGGGDVRSDRVAVRFPRERDIGANAQRNGGGEADSGRKHTA